MLTRPMGNLGELSRGRARLAISDDPRQVISSVCSAATASRPYFRLIEIPSDGDLKFAAATSQAVQVLAEAAKTLWSDLSSANSEDRSAGHEAVPAVDSFSAWYRQAATLVQSEKAPVLPGLNLTLQLERLSQLLDSDHLLLLVSLTKVDATRTDLQGFVALLEWLAVNSQARVLAAVDRDTAEHPALEPVRYDAWGFEVDLDRDTMDTQRISGTRRKPPARVYPIIGRPHPMSPGEQLLANSLHADAELKGLFLFNQPLISVLGNRFIVDLYWPEGRLVVEVDSYCFHSDAITFTSDRQRDYELQLSGALVLRVTHDEVMRDVTTVLEKLRKLIRLRRSKESNPPIHESI